MTCEADCTCGNDEPDAPSHLPRACPYGRKRKRVADRRATRTCSICGQMGHKKDSRKFHPLAEGEVDPASEPRSCSICGLTGHTKRSAAFHPVTAVTTPADAALLLDAAGRPTAQLKRAGKPSVKKPRPDSVQEPGGVADGSSDAADPSAAQPSIIAADGSHAVPATDSTVAAAPASPEAKSTCKLCGIPGHTSRNTRFHPKPKDVPHAMPNAKASSGEVVGPEAMVLGDEGGSGPGLQHADAPAQALASVTDAPLGLPSGLLAVPGDSVWGGDGETYTV